MSLASFAQKWKIPVIWSFPSLAREENLSLYWSEERWNERPAQKDDRQQHCLFSPWPGSQSRQGFFARESGFRTPQLSMFHLVTTVICPFGTKVFTRLLPPKQNAIQWKHEVADGFPGYTSSGPSAGPPRE